MALVALSVGVGEQFALSDGRVRCAFEMVDSHSSVGLESVSPQQYSETIHLRRFVIDPLVRGVRPVAGRPTEWPSE